MTTYAINAVTGATTEYTGYGFDSMCKGHDGKYYGIKADGIYLLEGGSDSSIDFGDLNFGSPALKHVVSAYANCSSAEPMLMTINGYEYEARSYSEEIKAQRFDTGRGLRKNYFSVSLTNQQGSDFTIDTVEIAAVATSRRI